MWTGGRRPGDGGPLPPRLSGAGTFERAVPLVLEKVSRPMGMLSRALASRQRYSCVEIGGQPVPVQGGPAPAGSPLRVPPGAPPGPWCAPFACSWLKSTIDAGVCPDAAHGRASLRGGQGRAGIPGGSSRPRPQPPNLARSAGGPPPSPGPLVRARFVLWPWSPPSSGGGRAFSSVPWGSQRAARPAGACRNWRPATRSARAARTCAARNDPRGCRPVSL